MMDVSLPTPIMELLRFQRSEGFLAPERRTY